MGSIYVYNFDLPSQQTQPIPNGINWDLIFGEGATILGEHPYAGEITTLSNPSFFMTNHHLFQSPFDL